MEFEKFKKIIDTIKEHLIWKDKFSNFLEENICTDSWCIVDVGDNLVNMLLEILKVEFKDSDDWIEWWLYEDVEKVVYYTDKNEERERSVEDIKDFYDFLVENYKN